MTSDPIRNIAQTKEVIAAVASLALRTRENLTDDGRISFLELIGFAAELPTVKKAVEGITQVPAELLDISDAEADEIGLQIHSILIQWGLTHRLGDISRELVSAAADIVQRIHRIIHLPPTAIPA